MGQSGLLFGLGMNGVLPLVGLEVVLWNLNLFPCLEIREGCEEDVEVKGILNRQQERRQKLVSVGETRERERSLTWVIKVVVVVMGKHQLLLGEILVERIH